jgi:hypothetical protein
MCRRRLILLGEGFNPGFSRPNPPKPRTSPFGYVQVAPTADFLLVGLASFMRLKGAASSATA